MTREVMDKGCVPHGTKIMALAESWSMMSRVLSERAWTSKE